MPRLSRRKLLAAGAAAAALPFAVRGQAQPEPLRIGAVLPIGGSALPSARINLRAAGEAARMGLILGEEDVSKNGELMGWSTVVTIANAPGADAAERSARRLIARDKVTVLVGGFTLEEAQALAEVAETSGVIFLNIAAPSDVLRHACRANTFHVEASAAMYLDAIFGWFVRAGYRRWYLVNDDGAESEGLYERALLSLKERHWAAEIAGHGVVRQDNTRDVAPVIADIGLAAPDVVLLLTDWRTQLDFLSHYEMSGFTAPVTGYPDPMSQTREFYYAARQAAPVAGSGHRAALWESTLDAYGARELNARFDARWGRPMDPPAWAAYQAVKIAFEASIASGGSNTSDLAAYIGGDRGLFDVSKGIGVTFRPWDHQMRQSLYLVKINPEASASMGLEAMLARASLVGELPAIYMPGTEPIERLDQLGDIDPSRTCT
jgi:ABC-type branched-subunit amino acid transport system substrate-binding protein